MLWYDGSIEDAVVLSKQRNAIFVVFVEDENDQSQQMAATIDDSAVVKRLGNQSNFLAIKLKSGSDNYTHFARLFKLVPVPSLFFISRNGTPLEVVCAGVQASNLATRIDRILDEHYKEKPPTMEQPSMLPSTSAQNIREQTVNLLHSEGEGFPPVPATLARPLTSASSDNEPETSSGPAAKIQKTHHEVTKSGKEYDVVCDGDVCVRTPKGKPDDPGPSQRAPNPATEPQEPSPTSADSVESVDDKTERAKEIIEARRLENIEKEKELERQKELERRAAGQGVAELKQWQADQELKQIQEERKREKMQNNLARQRILEQIAQDRAERRARDSPAQQAQPSHTTPVTSGDAAGTRARIQFKLPDGSSHTAHFDADGTLGDVQRYVADNLRLSTSNFALWTAFPRRELTETDATLRRLELAPSAALLVLPRRAPTTVASPSPVSSLITIITQFFALYILEPSHQLYAWIRERVFPPSAPPTSPGASPPRATPPPPPPGVRRRGNIHRLPGDRPSDDDNNTWNGNSTQQM